MNKTFFNYLGEYFQLPWGVFSASLDSICAYSLRVIAVNAVCVRSVQSRIRKAHCEYNSEYTIVNTL